MTGERMIKLYNRAVLGIDPDLQDDEEKEYYNSILQEMQETTAKAKAEGRQIVWHVPSE